MKYSGSSVVKKTRLLDLLSDENYIFRSEASYGSKMFAWGRMTLLERLLKRGIEEGFDWTELLQNNFGKFWESIHSSLGKAKLEEKQE